MRAAAWLAIAFCAGTALAAGSKPGDVKVELKNGAGQKAGTVTFKAVKHGVKISVKLENLPIGMHGVHIHQNAVCEGPDFKSAGPHFNPDGKKHGTASPMGPHAGDLPGNVPVGEDHRGEASFVLTDITLESGPANSIFANGGTSVVVHEKADDMKTDPSGASGNRIACAVVPAR